MKEHGILMSAPMVLAILAGQKSQTRRLAKFYDGAEYDGHRPDSPEVLCSLPNEPTGARAIKAPYAIGNRLWVKEALKRGDWPDDGQERNGGVKYAANDKWTWDMTGPCAWVWKRNALPSMFCPRGLSRITLEVTRVRVERVGDISEEDARAEGVERRRFPEPDVMTDCGHGYAPPLSSYVGAYEALWDEINGAGSFASNPWVWVYDFRRVG